MDTKKELNNDFRVDITTDIKMEPPDEYVVELNFDPTMHLKSAELLTDDEEESAAPIPPDIPQNAVTEILRKSSEGKYLEEACWRRSKFGEVVLDTKLRLRLCDLILEELMPAERGLEFPSNFELEKFSKAITEIFKAENPQLYFSPAAKKTEYSCKKNCSGWLVNARRKRKDKLISLEIASPPNKRIKTVAVITTDQPHLRIDLSHLDSCDEEETKSYISQLKNMNTHSCWGEISPTWDRTAKARIYNNYHQSRQLKDIFQEFPILSGPHGWRLLADDFRKVYPNSSMNLGLGVGFQTIVKKIIDYSREKEKKVNDKYVRGALHTLLNQCMSSDNEITKLTGALILINFLWKITPASTRKGATGSRLEVLRSFIRYSPKESDVQLDIAEPCIFAIGEEFDLKIRKYILYITPQVFWKFDSLAKAVDAEFKLLHATAAPYSRNCHFTWLLIQILFYKIRTAYDDKSRSLLELLSDMGCS